MDAMNRISILACVVISFAASARAAESESFDSLRTRYARDVRPLLSRLCAECHNPKKLAGELDFSRFEALADVRKDLKPWQGLIEQIEAGEMPPKDKPQPTAKERGLLIEWSRSLLDSEARARAGDPGKVPLRRLSNAEYDRTIRDLTGVDLRPTREFPADGAAGEGFTNAAEALTMSPALFAKYLAASKEIAAHAVFLPDGIRFSPSKTRRDWTDESLAVLRKFYGEFTPSSDGKLPLAPYLAATVRYRDELLANKTTLAAVAAKEKLNGKYLTVLWETLTPGKGAAGELPLDSLRTRWSKATEKDVPALAAEVAAWQTPLWNFVVIGSYRYGNSVRQVPVDPAVVESQPVRLNVKPEPGQSDVVLYLVARDLSGGDAKGTALWQLPRFEGGQPTPLLLRDYAEFGPKYEADYQALFSNSAKYLAAAVEAANDRSLTPDELAKKHGLATPLLKRWIDVLAIEPFAKESAQPREVGRPVPAVALTLLDEKTPRNQDRPAINGWKPKGAELPTVVSNASDQVENIPGRAAPHQVMVHPTPERFVAAAWKSPIEAMVRISGKVIHAHPACGNGVAWWVEHRPAERARVLAEGAVELGKESSFGPLEIKVSPGELVYLAVDAKESNHVCDLTEIGFSIAETTKDGRTWNVGADVADTIWTGNPHADKFGNKEVWSFVTGPTRALATRGGSTIPPDSVLGKWREAASDAKRQEEAGKLAAEVQSLLAGKRPVQEKSPNRILYDNFLSLDGALLAGLDVGSLPKVATPAGRYGLPKERFGGSTGGAAVDEASLAASLDKVVEVRLPAALFRGREFVVEAKLAPGSTERVAQFQVLTAPPAAAWDGKGPLVGTPNGSSHKKLLAGLADFRRVFPPFICYPHVIPLDEVVCLKTFHREDGPLKELFLDEKQAARIDRLWEEHRFITKFPVVENEYLPQFIGFVTQDQPKELLAYFESQREPFQKRADDFERDFATAEPKHLAVVLDFATRAYRRPLTDGEKHELADLYQRLRKSGVTQEEALRSVIGRVLVSPAFLYHLEGSPPGKQPVPVNDWELAARLSYFLWSSVPDDELRQLAAAGRLREPEVLAAQTERMLKDSRIRALAIEFGTQWIHVRGFDEFQEKSERHFPTFTPELRATINEESILFFQHLFQADRPATDIVDADYAFLNEPLARHYGISGVQGGEFRKVEGVKKQGRGGILGLASVQSKQAGASRTSPVLRGNWVVETLFGEKLPRPPPNVPKLPEEEAGNDGLTMRQLTEKHVRVAECAGCHSRIDPFGFALERYDAIGRLREKDLGGLPLDSQVKLRDGTEFEGIDGLRNYLLTKKKDVVLRLFCKRLLGYSLGRSTGLSDQPLIDDMMKAMNEHDGRIGAAVQTIVRSPQFRLIRGSEFVEE